VRRGAARSRGCGAQAPGTPREARSCMRAAMACEAACDARWRSAGGGGARGFCLPQRRKHHRSTVAAAADIFERMLEHPPQGARGMLFDTDCTAFMTISAPQQRLLAAARTMRCDVAAFAHSSRLARRVQLCLQLLQARLPGVLLVREGHL
jgi:hypothetical protein